MLSSGFLGALFITSFSGGSKPSATAGKPSVTRLIQRICMGSSGTGSPASMPRNIVITSPRLQASMQRINFRMLLYMTLPSSIAAIMVAKLSSSSTIDEASLVTSVPASPIAMPISASLTAGASLTPSPVMATMFPALLRALTIISLCFGETLA